MEDVQNQLTKIIQQNNVLHTIVNEFESIMDQSESEMNQFEAELN